ATRRALTFEPAPRSFSAHCHRSDHDPIGRRYVRGISSVCPSLISGDAKAVGLHESCDRRVVAMCETK
ncbi:MAG: hypothetical protein K2X41_12170, partial [Hyphomicrobium sp.]|nr:hypothetical protein [Hyphomicrobium sp.]